MALSISVPAGATNVQAYTGRGVLFGWSVRDTAATAAKVTLRDGTSTGGTPIALIGYASGESQTALVPGPTFITGLYVDRTTGSATCDLVLYLSED